MKRALKVFIVLGAALFTFIANATAASACLFGFYQPEVPESLKEK